MDSNLEASNQQLIEIVERIRERTTSASHLQNVADMLRIKYKDNSTPLHCAAKYGTYEQLKTVLDFILHELPQPGKL